MEEINKISEEIIGCAIEVHKNLGPGLLESLYEEALCIEFKLRDINFKRQVVIPVKYKEHKIGEHRIDIIVKEKVIVELKAVDNIIPVFEAQILSYIKMTGLKLGLLINFNVPALKEGIQRVIL